jgi:hypothetical protein
MFDIERAKDQAFERYEQERNILDFLEDKCDILPIRHINGKDIFMSAVDTYEEFRDLLLTCSRLIGLYELSFYYTHENALACNYKFIIRGSGEVIDIVLYCRDIETTLERVSHGKCRIETQSSTTQKVVCTVGSDE